jgi:hypothetical protein
LRRQLSSHRAQRYVPADVSVVHVGRAERFEHLARACPKGSLELEDYARLPAHRAGFIAERLGISSEDEQMYLDALVAAGQARSDGTHYVPTAIQTVDTRSDARRAASLRNFFSRLATERAAQSAQGTSGYNVFAVSRADYRRIVELQRNYFAQLRAIVAESTPTQVVGLASTHLLILSDEHTPKAEAPR